MTWPASLILNYGDHGERVKRLQKALTNGKFGNFHPGPIDGQFGTRTSSAVHGAKWFLGYPGSGINFQAGLPLVKRLEGTSPLTDEMRRRRVARLLAEEAEKAKVPMRRKALEFAKADIGLHEATNNNIKYNDWWTGGHNDGAPYCVRAGSYWYKKAGSTIINPAAGLYQSTDYLLEDAKNRHHGVHLISDPAPGDGFVIDFSGKADPDHFGLFHSDGLGGSFHSIEANATDPSGRQGVDRHMRDYRNCWFIRFEH